MDARPRNLAVRMSEADERLIRLPLNAARRKVREIIEQSPNNGRLWLLLEIGDCSPTVRLSLLADILRKTRGNADIARHLRACVKS
jgi:hypothetical protein